MAVGDVVVFEEAKAAMLESGWPAADSIEIDLVLATSTPAAADGPLPKLADYNLATSTEGGQVLGAISACVTEAGGVMTFDDPASSKVWATGGGLSTTVRWAIIYNQSSTVPATDSVLAYVDLGSDRDLTAGSLTITWNGSGIFTIT